jgi:hypothetical protein
MNQAQTLLVNLAEWFGRSKTPKLLSLLLRSGFLSFFFLSASSKRLAVLRRSRVKGRNTRFAEAETKRDKRFEEAERKKKKRQKKQRRSILSGITHASSKLDAVMTTCCSRFQSCARPTKSTSSLFDTLAAHTQTSSSRSRTSHGAAKSRRSPPTHTGTLFFIVHGPAP